MKKMMLMMVIMMGYLMPYKVYSGYVIDSNSPKALLGGMLVSAGSGLASVEFERRQGRFFTKNEVALGSIIIPSLMYSFLDKNVNSTLFALATGLGMYFSMETLINITIDNHIKDLKELINVEKVGNRDLPFSTQEITEREAKLRQLALLMDRQKMREGSIHEVIERINLLATQRENFKIPLRPLPVQNQNGLVEKSREMKNAAENFAEEARNRAELITQERQQYKQSNPGVWGKIKVFCKDAIDDWDNTF